MKLLAALVAVLASAPAFAENLYGQLVAQPASVKVFTVDGGTASYAITSVLNTGSVYDNSVSLSQNGVMAMCGDYLGQLAEDFSITIKTEKGERKTITVRAARGKDRQVSVFGICQSGSNALDQLQIDVQSGSGPEIK